MNDLRERQHDYSDEDLVKLIVSTKDTRYFSVLYDKYASFIYNKCFSFVDSEDEAQDLTHDIFIKIYLNLKTFKGESKLSTWIYAIAYHFCINYVNKNKKGKVLLFDEIEDFISENDETFLEDEHDEALFEINYAKLQKILAALPVDDRLILLMKYQDELSIKEISRILNVKLSTVKMRLHRAKKKVMELREL